MINKKELKQNIKISDVVSAEWWELMKQWKNQYLCRCINPVHLDENPSMSINNEKWIFKCFSCEIWWDIFNVLDYMKPDINSFYNQLKYLENTYYWKAINKPLSLWGKQEIKVNFQDDKDFIEIMNYIANYWASKLPKEIKDKYILNSKTFSYKAYKWDLITMQWYGLNEKIVNKYKLWYSSYDSKLYKELLTKFDKDLINKTGLFDNNWVSLFKRRITIPHFINWNVVCFSSRQTEYSPINKYEQAKYKNQKIDNKYYFNEDDLNSPCVFITEWYFDCLALKNIWYNSISLWWLYIKNKSKLIEWLKDSLVYITFDNDLNKSWNDKAIKLQKTLKENWINSFIITLPLEKNKKKIDVNEYLWNHSKQKFNKLLTF